jgi:hypothetical protein
MTTLRGQVTAGGEAARDAVVEVRNAAGDIVDQVTVDDRGGFTYHLAGGMWSLRAWDPHGGRAVESVELGGDEDVVVDLELKSQEDRR